MQSPSTGRTLSSLSGRRYSSLVAAPDLAAARRAADELVRAGAGRVLLFGSVARGEAGQSSDIDLVAIYDDLGDYSTRSKHRCALERSSCGAVPMAPCRHLTPGRCGAPEIS